MIELQVHGNQLVLQNIINLCLQYDCRLAEPGEFSKRAYLNNKIDLLQAEAIADLINAETNLGAKAASNVMQGSFSKYINAINERLINLRIYIEASLDFPEEDIEFILSYKVQEKLNIIIQELYNLLKSTKCGVIINNGINIAIIGKPNVGKSSLINALTLQDTAIVTDIAGTTRDVIKEKVTINGLACNILDTAGIRNTNDYVEQIGVNKSIDTIKNADICLILINAIDGLDDEDIQIIKYIPDNTKKILVYNKTDLPNLDLESNSNNNSNNNHNAIATNNTSSAAPPVRVAESVP